GRGARDQRGHGDRARAYPHRMGARMTPLANIIARREGDVVVAEIHGEIDASNTGWAGTRLRALLTNHSDAMAVDLSHTTYLDSAGLALLFDLGAELRLRQQTLH